MIALPIVVLICLFLSAGHIRWGLDHPFRILRESTIDEVVPASLHACWYHVSVVFLVTALACLTHMAALPLSTDAFVLLWLLNFLCWLCYLGTLYFFPGLWKAVWPQIVLIAIVLGSLGWFLVVNPSSA